MAESGDRQPATGARDSEANEPIQQWERPTKSGRLASQIGREELESHFHTPVDVASTNMGVGLTKLKAICRSLNISRWPYRRIRRLQYLSHRVLGGYASILEVEDAMQLLTELDLPPQSPVWVSSHIDVSKLIVAIQEFVRKPPSATPPPPNNNSTAAPATDSVDSQADTVVAANGTRTSSPSMTAAAHAKSASMLADYLVKHKVNVQALAATPRIDYPPPAPSEQPPLVSQPLAVAQPAPPLLAAALAAMAQQVAPPASSASMEPASASLLLQSLGMPVLMSRFSQQPAAPPKPEPLAEMNRGSAVLSALLNIPIDPGTVRIEQLPPEVQQVLVPMFIAWLQRLIGAH